MLLELPGNSAGTPRKLQKPKIPTLRKGFRVFGKAHDFVMERLPQSNEKMMRRSLAKDRKGHPKIWDSMERLPQKSQFPDTLGDVFMILR